MALSSHMAFARNAAGQVVAASDLPSIGQAGFLCVGCGAELTLCRPNNSQASFKHVRPVACELGALRALHAAALQLLVESRFVETPPLTPGGNRDGGRRMIEEWGGEVSVCTKVDGVPVDLYAETLAGPLIIQVAIKPLYDATTRPVVRTLGYAALEISIPKPDEVLSVGDLREVVLHGPKNKIWLWHSATGNRLAQPERRPVEMALLFGEVERPAAKLSMPVAVPPWVGAGGLAIDAAYRQLPVAEKIRSLEQQLGVPCACWPDAIGIDVVGEDSFGLGDPRIWQADVFGKFVHPHAQAANGQNFSMLKVLGWLYMRYEINPAFEDAEKVAVYQYLRELTAQGYLMDLPDQQYRVLPGPHPDARPSLKWNPDARLTVSGLRVCAEQVRLEIPANQVQRLLEYFEDGHPAVPVAAFVQDLIRRLHAPERTIVALLREAALVL